MKSDLVEVCILGKTVGLKGALKLHNRSDFIEQYKKGAKFYDKFGNLLSIKSYEPSNSLVIFDGFESIEAAKAEGTAFVFMGHGTSHTAKVSYSQMQTQMGELGYDNVFIGTVEGEPEETACEAVIDAVAQAGYKKVILRPLMVVAGDHANNDMAGDDEDSWKSIFTASGKFDSVDAQITGLGSIDAIQQLYVAHTKDVINE